MVDDASFPEWVRAGLGLWLLSIVARDESHGYAIAKALGEAGLGEVKGGTLYPALARLEADGLVRSRWVVGDGGPGRKLFSITPSGVAMLHKRTRQWRALAQRTNALLSRTTEDGI